MMHLTITLLGIHQLCSFCIVIKFGHCFETTIKALLFFHLNINFPKKNASLQYTLDFKFHVACREGPQEALHCTNATKDWLRFAIFHHQ